MNNPFRLKKQADDMEAAEIASLFGEPPGFEKFLQPTHHFLIGGRGSGKTTLLRAVCSSVVDKRSQRNKVPFFGVYVPFKQFEVGRFVRSFELTGSASPFWLYFASELFLRIMEQIQDSSRFNAFSDEFDTIVRRVFSARSVLVLRPRNKVC